MKLRTLAAATACTVAMTALAMPANAAEIGEQKDGRCAVKFSKEELNYARGTFDQSKKIGGYERARDVAGVIEGVFAEASIRTEHVQAVYEQAKRDLETLKPTTGATQEDFDLNNFTVEPVKGNGFPKIATVFPLENTDGLTKEQVDKLNAAWVATPSGQLEKRVNTWNVSVKLAENACESGISKVIAFPEDHGNAGGGVPGVDLSSISSQSGESNVDVIAGVVISVLVALVGLVGALPKMGIQLPFELKL